MVVGNRQYLTCAYIPLLQFSCKLAHKFTCDDRFQSKNLIFINVHHEINIQTLNICTGFQRLPTYYVARAITLTSASPLPYPPFCRVTSTMKPESYRFEITFRYLNI